MAWEVRAAAAASLERCEEPVEFLERGGREGESVVSIVPLSSFSSFRFPFFPELSLFIFSALTAHDRCRDSALSSHAAMEGIRGPAREEEGEIG